MLKKITELKASKLFLLTTFAIVNIEEMINKAASSEKNIDQEKYLDKLEKNIPKKYREVMELTYKNKDMNVSFDISKVIDDLMFDNYKNYDYLNRKCDSFALSFVIDVYKDVVDFNLYLKTFEEIMLKTKFENSAIRTVQKMFFANQMKKEITNENYEQCSILTEKIKEI